MQSRKRYDVLEIIIKYFKKRIRIFVLSYFRQYRPRRARDDHDEKC